MTEYQINPHRPVEDQLPAEVFEALKRNVIGFEHVIVGDSMVLGQLGGEPVDVPDSVASEFGGTTQDWYTVARYLAGWVADRCWDNKDAMITTLRESIAKDVAIAQGIDDE